MGVHGLTTFLRENKNRLASTLTFAPVSNDAEKTPLVVDAWSFLYKLFQDSGLPWVYGGEYDAFVTLIVRIVRAWLAVGLRPLFVFDGPTPPKKFATVLARLNAPQPSQLYFRTSPASRNTRRFLNEARIIPPLMFSACLRALSTFRQASSQNDLNSGGWASGSDDERVRNVTVGYDDEVGVYFADEEGDPYAVELAGRVRGYIAGRDSDFVVMNSEGYLGYLPLDELLWIREAEEPVDEAEGGDEDGFTTVVKGKSKKRGAVTALATPKAKTNGKAKTRMVTSIAGNGMIPPGDGEATLTASLYKPATLAQLFGLPISVLPLVGAFVGNDYTLQAADTPANDSPSASYNTTFKQSFQRLLFPRSFTLAQRITHTAATLAAFLRPHATANAHAYTGKRTLHRPPQTAMELIQWTVRALLANGGAPASLLTSGQEELVVEQVVQGTLPYALPLGPSDDAPLDPGICALHDPEECRLTITIDRLADAPAVVESTGEVGPNEAGRVAELYLRAYRAGLFSPLLMDTLSTRSFWPEIFLEHPDHEAVARSISRPIRVISYALLEDGLGLPVFESDLEEEVDEGIGVEEYGGDPDELIDVVEEHSEDELEEDESDFDEMSDVSKLRGALRNLQYDNDPMSSSIMTDASESTAPDEQSIMSESEVNMQNSVISEPNGPTPHVSAAQMTRRTSECSMTALRKRWPKEMPKTVLEYVRRGTRVVAEEVEVPTLAQIRDSSTSGPQLQQEALGDIHVRQPSIQLRSPSERFASICTFLFSRSSTLEALSVHDRMPVLVLRHIVRRMHQRAIEAGNSKEKQAGRWTRREARAFLASLASPSSDCHISLSPPEEVSERSIQLTAQVSTTLEAVEHLTQVLFLTALVPGCAHRFSGRRFHALLSLPPRANADEEDPLRIDEAVWLAVEGGLEGCFGEERGKKARKKARETDAASNANGGSLLHVSAPGMSRSSSTQSGKNGVMGSASIYALLADADI